MNRKRNKKKNVILIVFRARPVYESHRHAVRISIRVVNVRQAPASPVGTRKHVSSRPRTGYRSLCSAGAKQMVARRRRWREARWARPDRSPRLVCFLFFPTIVSPDVATRPNPPVALPSRLDPDNRIATTGRRVERRTGSGARVRLVCPTNALTRFSGRGHRHAILFGAQCVSTTGRGRRGTAGGFTGTAHSRFTGTRLTARFPNRSSLPPARAPTPFARRCLRSVRAIAVAFLSFRRKDERNGPRCRHHLPP